MVAWSTVAILLAACAACGALCVAIAHAFLHRRADRASYRIAAAWAACFAVLLAGTLVVADAVGDVAAASFAIVVCAASFPLCGALGRWQRNRDTAAAVAYLQLHRCASAPLQTSTTTASASERGWGSDLEARCARLARAYDLTRREEDVLRLLMEGCTFAEAADELVVSVNTVKSHVRHVYAKMGASGKQDLLEKIASAD